MAKRLDKSDIASLNTIRPYHVSQSVDAFTGEVAYDINVSGSFQVTGSTILSGSVTMQTLTNTAQTDVLTYNSSTGRVYYTASNAFADDFYFKQNGNSFGTTAILGTNDNNALRFETNATTKMHIGTDGNVGINTTTPLGKFTVSGSDGYLSYNDTNAAGNLLQLSGSSDELVRVDVSTPSSSQVAAISYGVRGTTETSYPGYGGTGDAFMYASTHANGLNLINLGGGNKADYIRFYAGRDANGTTPDIHIQGSGSTRGYVGVNTENPTSHLHISGTLANGLSVTTSGISSHAEGFGARSSGAYSHAEGVRTHALGPASHAEGYQTTASGDYSHAEGRETLALGNNSHAEGYLTTASNSYSHTEGISTRTPGYASHAEGYQTIASGDYSHAEGGNTVATGNSAHAEGIQNLASGEASHAEGFQTTASGYYSHAEGHGTISSGSYSHAEGYQTVSYGDYSHAEGIGTISSGSLGQTVVGRYNTHNDSTSRFIVGGGVDNLTRSDAFKVTNNNSIVVAPRAAAPAWIGIEGEMVPAIVGGVFYLYVYLGGNWRKTTLT